MFSPLTPSLPLPQGVVYRNLGALSKSFTCLDSVHTTRLTKNGPNSRSTHLSYISLALLQEAYGRYEEATDLYLTAVRGMNAVNPSDPLLLDAVGNLAGAKIANGDWTVGVKMLKRVLEGKERTLGRGSRSTLTTVDNLACALLRSEEEEDLVKAGELFRRVEEGIGKVLREGHPEVFETFENISIMHARRGEWGLACKYKEVSAEQSDSKSITQPFYITNNLPLVALLIAEGC